MKKIDKEIIKLAKDANQSAIDEIFEVFKPIVSAIARKYFLIGGEKEDLIQEGMIGLFKAITIFDFDKNDNFENFAIKLIEREIISAIRRANSNKNQILDESVYLEEDIISAGEKYPELDIISIENYKEFNEEINRVLSSFERQVVSIYLKGYTYTDIARILKKSNKSIDNALSRIKTKLKYLKEKL